MPSERREIEVGAVVLVLVAVAVAAYALMGGASSSGPLIPVMQPLIPVVQPGTLIPLRPAPPPPPPSKVPQPLDPAPLVLVAGTKNIYVLEFTQEVGAFYDVARAAQKFHFGLATAEQMAPVSHVRGSVKWSGWVADGYVVCKGMPCQRNVSQYAFFAYNQAVPQNIYIQLTARNHEVRLLSKTPGAYAGQISPPKPGASPPASTHLLQVSVALGFFLLVSPQGGILGPMLDTEVRAVSSTTIAQKAPFGINANQSAVWFHTSRGYLASNVQGSISYLSSSQGWGSDNPTLVMARECPNNQGHWCPVVAKLITMKP